MLDWVVNWVGKLISHGEHKSSHRPGMFHSERRPRGLSLRRHRRVSNLQVRSRCEMRPYISCGHTSRDIATEHDHDHEPHEELLPFYGHVFSYYINAPGQRADSVLSKRLASKKTLPL